MNGGQSMSLQYVLGGFRINVVPTKIHEKRVKKSFTGTLSTGLLGNYVLQKNFGHKFDYENMRYMPQKLYHLIHFQKNFSMI
jgi:hypothetical protein